MQWMQADPKWASTPMMQDIERVEIINGATGFLYGGGRVGGAVNYITKKPNEEIKDIEFASIQSLFSLGTQNKYTLHFGFDEATIEQILANPEMQENFLKEYKPIITKELDFYTDNLIFRDIHRGSLGVTCFQIESSEETDILIYLI